jgi:hypothetical protein
MKAFASILLLATAVSSTLGLQFTTPNATTGETLKVGSNLTVSYFLFDGTSAGTSRVWVYLQPGDVLVAKHVYTDGTAPASGHVTDSIIIPESFAPTGNSDTYATLAVLAETKSGVAHTPTYDVTNIPITITK